MGRARCSRLREGQVALQQRAREDGEEREEGGDDHAIGRMRGDALAHG